MSVSFFFFKQKTAYEITRRDWSSDVCSSDLAAVGALEAKTLTSSACCTPAPPGVKGTAPATWLTAKTRRTFLTDAPTRKASRKNQKAAPRESQANACRQATSRR